MDKHDVDTTSWWVPGMWTRCVCGFDPHDNGLLYAHWAEHGFRIVDHHGHLVKEPV